MKVEEMADVHFLLLPPFFNLNNKIFQLEITIWDKKFNKHVTIDLKMTFGILRRKTSEFHEIRLKKWTFENFWTQFGVLH